MTEAKAVSCLYKITFPNGKVYIGITRNFSQRMRDHKKLKSPRLLVSVAIKKYGWENTVRQILVIGEITYLQSIEERAIQIYGSRTPLGYNVAIGGGALGQKQSQRTRELRAAIMREKWKDPAYRAKVILGVTGTVKSPAARAKMRDLKIGKRLTAAHRQALSDSHKGLRWSESSKQKLSITKTGKPRGKRVSSS